MYKLVVLLSVAAMAAANPGLVAPAVYSAVVPGVSSLSQYSTHVSHGSPVYRAPAGFSAPAVYSSPAVYSAPAVYSQPAVVASLSPYHHLHKRSLAYSTAVAPISYASPVVSAYSPVVSGYSTPVVASPVAYSTPVVASPVAYSTPVVAAHSPIGYSGQYPRALSVHPY